MRDIACFGTVRRYDVQNPLCIDSTLIIPILFNKVKRAQNQRQDTIDETFAVSVNMSIFHERLDH